MLSTWDFLRIFQKIINFLSRTVIRQDPSPENEEFIKDMISQYFIGDVASIKSKIH